MNTWQITKSSRYRVNILCFLSCSLLRPCFSTSLCWIRKSSMKSEVRELQPPMLIVDSPVKLSHQYCEQFDAVLLC